MCNIADAAKGGKIEALLNQPDIRNKKILSFDLQAASFKKDDITEINEPGRTGKA